jgi:hypothetical protein
LYIIFVLFSQAKGWPSEIFKEMARIMREHTPDARARTAIQQVSEEQRNSVVNSMTNRNYPPSRKKTDQKMHAFLASPISESRLGNSCRLWPKLTVVVVISYKIGCEEEGSAPAPEGSARLSEEEVSEEEVSEGEEADRMEASFAVVRSRETFVGSATLPFPLPLLANQQAPGKLHTFRPSFLSKCVRKDLKPN